MASTGLAVRNVVHATFDEFVQSKPKVRPLETEEYVSYEDPAHRHPKMVSCKMKTVDHLRAEYGPGNAGEEGTCAALNALTLRGVLSGLTPAERRRLRFDRGRTIVFDADVVSKNGGAWIAPFTMATVGADGALHVVSQSMRNDWTDPSRFNRPVSFRGTRYCHLIAPEYLRRILLGEVEFAPGAPRS